MKAYLVQLGSYDAVVLSETRSKAKAAMLRSAHEAGYERYRYIDVRATRAPGFDHLITPLPCSRRVEPHKPYSLEYVSAPCRCSKCEEARNNAPHKNPD